MTIKRSDVERLQEIKDEIKDLLGEAKEIVRGATFDDGSGRARTLWERAKAYWVAHIEMALDDDHMWLGSGSCTMQDTVDELTERLEEEEEEEEDEEA